MRNWTDRVGFALLVLLGLTWVAAKLHFLTRYWEYYEAGDIRGYILEHWPFWAAGAFIGALLLLLGLVERRRPS